MRKPSFHNSQFFALLLLFAGLVHSALALPKLSIATVRGFPGKTVDVPVFLAGGLRPENVSDAIRTVRPYGVDVCSGVRAGGKLDPGNLARFVRAVEETG